MGQTPRTSAGRKLAEEVAQAGARGVEGLEVAEVAHPRELRRDEDGEDEQRHAERGGGSPHQDPRL